MSSGDLGARICETLARQTAWPSLSAIAETIGTSPGALHPWAMNLFFFQALRPSETGLVVDRPRLLRYFTARRIGALQPQRERLVHGSVEEIHGRLVAHGIPHVFGFFTAADRWAFYESRKTIQLFVPPRASKEIDRAFERPTRHTPAAIRLEPFEERLESIPMIEREGIPITDPLRTILDLRAHPEGARHADHLENNVLPRWLSRP